MTGVDIYGDDDSVVRSRRLLSCLLLLQTRRRMTVRELATELDVSMRTVHRDVEALCEAGVPIYMERGPLGGIVLGDEYRRALAHFTPDDLRRLFASGPNPLADLDAVDSRVLQKLASALPTRARETAEAARDRLLVDNNRWSRAEQPTETLRLLRTASDGDRSVRLRYRDRAGTATDRVVDPLGLVAKAGVWYLIAREADQGYRTFRAERIDGVEETDEVFVRPADFQLEAYWNQTVRSVERDFEPYVAVVRARPAAVTRLSSYYSFDVRETTAEGVVLAVRFRLATSRS